MPFKTITAALTLLVISLASVEAYVIMDSPSPDQLSQDQRDCAAQARTQESTSGQRLQTPAPTNGGPLSGPVRGALFGTAAGAAYGNAARGATLGALGGSMNRGMRQSDSSLQASAMHEDVSQAQQDVYNHTFNACMQARGYDID